MTDLAYHLVPEPWFLSQPPDKPYLPEPFDADGFVHLTHGEDEVLAVGNTFYTADSRPYLLLTINLARITAEVRYDDPDRRFPHVYGPLDRRAIVAIRQIERSPSGGFLAIVG